MGIGQTLTDYSIEQANNRLVRSICRKLGLETIEIESPTTNRDITFGIAGNVRFDFLNYNLEEEDEDFDELGGWPLLLHLQQGDFQNLGGNIRRYKLCKNYVHLLNTIKKLAAVPEYFESI